MTKDRVNPGARVPSSAQDGAHVRGANESLNDTEVVDADAAAWLVRRQDGVDLSVNAEFQTWLAADPAHRTSFAQMVDIWNALGEITVHDVAKLKAGLPGNQVASQLEPRSLGGAKYRAEPPDATPNMIGRRRFIPRAAFAGAMFAAVGAGWIGWDYSRRQPTFTQAYATERGEFLTVPLPDGSTVELDTDSRIEVALYRQRREVRLARGQAMFTVQSDPNCPFDVLAGPLKVTVVGTRFSVRYTQTGLGNGNVNVAVQEGRVRVASAGGAQRTGLPGYQSLELTAGQRVSTDPAGNLGAIASIAPGEVALWRKGRVSFDNTPLIQAIEEFERYADTGLVIRDSLVRAMRITGSFDIQEATRFAHALPRVLPVRLQTHNGTTEIVRAG